MKRSLAPHALVVSFLLLAGCPLVGGGGGDRAGNGIDPYYDRYTGPLQVGRSYEFQTVEQNTFTEVGGDYDPQVSPDGTRLIFASTSHSPMPDIYMKAVNAATVTGLTSTSWAEIQPCFHPNGKLFAYATNRRGNWDICIQSLEGGKSPVWVTHSMKSDEISPSFHPGGEWIAFSTYNLRSGRWEIAAKHLRSGRVRYLGEGLYPRFSPDGKKIAFQRARSRAPRWYSIWTVDVDADLNVSSPTEVVSSAKWAAINPAWSPDSKYLAFATVHESPVAQATQRILMGDDIWIVNLQGQDLIKLTDTEAPESHPAWATDREGKPRVYFCSMIKGPKNVWSLRPQLPDPYGSVAGPLPGPAPAKSPPPAPKKPGKESSGDLNSYLYPPPPAVTAVTAGGADR
jgi:Tol biopolymer transport system component